MEAMAALGLGTMGLVGIGMAAFGMLMAFAAGMSSAPSDNSGKGGCLVAAIGLILFVVAVIGAIVEAVS